jgi:hypothetical protein
MLIVDEDCDVEVPCPVDDQFIQEHGIFIPANQANQNSSSLLTTIHVVRSLQHLVKIFKSESIAAGTLENFDSHLSRCMAVFSPEWQLGSNQYLDPRSLAPILYLQNARFLLHRHNLSPACTPDMRKTALDHCIAVAHETTRLLSRCMQTAPSSPNHPPIPGGFDNWQSRLRMAASTFMCTHIWRCTLVLLLRRDYGTALGCIHASSTIADHRPVNISCGRNVAFFLRCMIDKIQHGAGMDLEKDEEMMAYVSGDLQGSTDSSWIWQGSETGMQLSEIETHNLRHPEPHMLAMDAERRAIRTLPSQDDATALPASTALTEAEAKDWGGWEWVEATVSMLLAEQQQRVDRQKQFQQQQYRDETRQPQQSSPGKGSESSTAQQPRAPPQASPASASRMTIANII